MPLWKNTQHAFIAGQLDANVMGRQDMNRYFKGATLLKNFLVKRQGCISKRRGTDLTADLDGLLGTTYDGTPIVPDKMRLVPVTNGDDGRYVILSGGIGFVANRDGLLTSDNKRIRSVRPYVAQDSSGKPVVITGKDGRHSTEKPVDVIRRLSSGSYKVRRYASLQAAFDAAKNNDTVRLHCNLRLTSTATVTPGTTWKTDGGASATVTWDGDHAGHPNQYKIVVGGSTYYSTESDYYGNRSVVTYTSGSTTVTVTRSNKHVTLDLYGYKLTISTSTGIAVRNASVSLSVESSRVGGKVAVIGSGSNTIGFQLDSRSTGVKSGALHLAGDIEYDLLAGPSGHWIVYAKDTTGVVIDAGTFTSHDVCHTLVAINGGSLTVNGGRFAAEATGNNYVHLIETLHDTGVSQASTATINGGEFVNPSSYTYSTLQYCSFIFCNKSGSVVVNGGRFTYASPANFCMLNAIRGQTYWPMGYMRILRGEFSQQKIKNTYDSAEHDLIEYTGDSGDTTSRTATQIWFSTINLTATASSWRLSDAGSLTCAYETGSNRWHIWGTRAAGGNVNEYADGSPAATEITFASCGITATRTWTFSDGGSWPISYANSGWNVTKSVPNEVQPNAEGFYGIKVGGEGDYTYDSLLQGSIPYRFAIPYEDKDLADICIRQSGDTLFLAHRDYPPARIYFDMRGWAYFEELKLDNTDYQPPVIESAVMVGNEPRETDNWPAEFATPPSWLDNTQQTAVAAFKTACKALGTVTDAGFSGNKADGNDGSCSYACSYTCTSVHLDRSTGKKTTTISVKSFTKSITCEELVNYVDGLAVGSRTKTTTTPGSAENSASATSVIVTRTVRYVATYIKNGRESRPSVPFAVDYDMPWANNAVVNLTIGKGANDTEPDYYNVYKDNGSGYGLIATVGVERIVGGIAGIVDTYPLFMPDNTASAARLANAADWEESKGWAVGDIFRKMISSGKDSFTSSPANDICLVNTASNEEDGIVIDFTGATGARFDRIGVMLDGRIYDKASNASYIIISTNRVTATVTYIKSDGTTGTVAQTQNSPVTYSFGGIAGGMFIGIYEDWAGLPRKAFTAPNGDTVYGHLYGKGDCTDEFNAHLRRLNFDFRSAFAALEDFAGVKSVAFTFAESVYSNWSNNQQGCIHAIHFYSGSSADSGMVQDDYINPDMTVTPPNDTQDAHFSAAGDYPGCVGIYQQRLCFASTGSSPSTLWMSGVADLYNFTAHDSIREDDALELTLAATEFPNINHLVTGRDLMLFGDGGEWLISPVTGNALTYKTASAKLQSMIGSDRALQPLQLADETLFAERGGTCLRSINYNYTSDSYQSEDLSVIAQSVFRANPIVSMAYKQHPDSIVECVLADGRVATLVYMKEQEVAAWSVQELGGGWKAKEIVSPKCIVNGTTEMMLLVEKSGVFQLWKVRDDDDTPVAASQVVLDGMHIETSAAPTGTDEEGVALGDGRYAVGYPVEAEFVSVRPEPEKGQTAQMEIKNATEAELRVTDATTFSVKPYGASSGWREVSLPAVRDGASVALSSKDCKKLMTGSNNRDGRLHLKHVEPWPLTVLSVSTTYQVEYENGGNEQ